MTFEQLTREPQHLLLKCISGSQAYNLALPDSDTDLKGIFVLPRKELYGLDYTPQVANASNDEVFFELGRFLDLLSKNNPNILELLSTPAPCVLYRHPLMDLVRPEDFLSKLCLDTFAGYAKTQIKKARGLNKKINRSFEQQRKSVLDFCHVVAGKGTVPLIEWLATNGFDQADCGLVHLDHFRDAYLLYYSAPTPSQANPVPVPAPSASPTPPQSTPTFRGIISGQSANDVQLSSVPADLAPAAVMHFNKDAYSLYCRDYTSYWQWVEERNEERYQNTLSHGKNYDAKNMMHTFRLLSMAGEIALHHRVLVHRDDRDFLLRIRRGEFEYETLLQMVEEKMTEIEALYAKSTLPEAPDPRLANQLLVQMRESFYQ